MFKDYDKYLSTSIKVYFFVLLFTIILKVVGIDYFGLDVNNHIIVSIDNIMQNQIIKNIVYFTLIMIYQYLMVGMITNKNIIKPTIYSIPFTFILNGYIKPMIPYAYVTTLIEMVYLFILCSLIHGISKEKTKRFFVVVLLTFIFQALSKVTRYRVSPYYIKSISVNILLNFDYMIMMLMSYNVFKVKGDRKLCQIFQAEVGSCSLKKMNLNLLLKKLQVNYHSFKEQDKETKLTIIIYLLLSSIWNIFSVIFVLIIAQLNHTFIECIFILTSFWLSKRSFGKPFHLSSMVYCFIVSNASYYILNRITTPLGISMLVPIMLGVGLSYLTSKLVKKTYKPLYRGMPEDLFNETILKVVDKDSDNYNICYEFYINKVSDLSLSFKYKYSVAGIRKIKDRINQKIKRL